MPRDESLYDPYFPQRAAAWQLRTRTLQFGARPLLMGIVNVTPDSFSDGGRYLDTSAAIKHALQLARDGADILDIGGESTRPYSHSVSLDEELARVVAVVKAIGAQTQLPISIDTSKAAVAQACLDAGAEIINDVTGLAGDPDMLSIAQRSGAGVCAMHMLGNPQTMQDDPQYDDVVTDIRGYLAARRDALLAAGIPRERICLDPGIGFGKTHQHNVTLMANAWRFHDLGCPLLVGHSRKGFIAKLISAELNSAELNRAEVNSDKQSDRTAGTIGAACALALQGVQIIRVHDVRAVRDALLLFDACRPKISD